MSAQETEFGLTLEELWDLAKAKREIVFREDTRVFEGETFPDNFKEKHPDILSVALSCDPALANVLLFSDDGVTGFEYDAEADVLTLRYERSALAAEVIGGLESALMVSKVRVSGWVRLGYDGEKFVIAAESDSSSASSVQSSDVKVFGAAKSVLGAVSEWGAPIALGKLISSSCVVFVQVGDESTMLLRADACGSDDKTLQARYALKHVILDYGGFLDADLEEPGIVEDVFADRRMWLWSFSSVDESEWGGSLLVPNANAPVYEV